MTTKMVIPAEAVQKIKTTLDHILAHPSHQDSVNAKIWAINSRLGGWCRYYQYTSKAATQFSELEHDLFWKMAHWLGRKFKMHRPAVMRRFHTTGRFATPEASLIKPTELKSLQYRDRFFKPNPYLMRGKKLSRETLLEETYWTGYEHRPGMADLRPRILARDQYTCQHCGAAVTTTTGEVGHIKPVRRFKRPIDANVPENLWTLCRPCHAAKTQQDRQVESRMRGERACPVRRRA
jgi:ferredoxin